MRDQYSANCAHRLRHLKLRFPHCVWAAPEGIVQHEFFVGETPVIAYKTGGLKDSVIEF